MSKTSTSLFTSGLTVACGLGLTGDIAAVDEFLPAASAAHDICRFPSNVGAGSNEKQSL